MISSLDRNGEGRMWCDGDCRRTLFFEELKTVMMKKKKKNGPITTLIHLQQRCVAEDVYTARERQLL